MINHTSIWGLTMNNKALYGKEKKRAVGENTLERLLSEPGLTEIDNETRFDELLGGGHEEIIMMELKAKFMALKNKISQMDELIEHVKCSLYT